MMHHFVIEPDAEDAVIWLCCLICERRAAWPNNDPEHIKPWFWSATQELPGREPGEAPRLVNSWPLVLSEYVAAAREHMAVTHGELSGGE